MPSKEGFGKRRWDCRRAAAEKGKRPLKRGRPAEQSTFTIRKLTPRTCSSQRILPPVEKHIVELSKPDSGRKKKREASEEEVA